MAMTPEGKTKAAVKKILDQYGVYHFSPAANGYGRVGVPDIICCVNGYFLAIECKAGKGKTTALQDRELTAIRGAGGEARVINEDGVAILHILIEIIKNRPCTK
jgi:Holliday junction resolvase